MFAFIFFYSCSSSFLVAYTLFTPVICGTPTHCMHPASPSFYRYRKHQPNERIKHKKTHTHTTLISTIYAMFCCCIIVALILSVHMQFSLNGKNQWWKHHYFIIMNKKNCTKKKSTQHHSQTIVFNKIVAIIAHEIKKKITHICLLLYENVR